MVCLKENSNGFSNFCYFVVVYIIINIYNMFGCIEGFFYNLIYDKKYLM